MNQMKPKKMSPSGFTLIEMIVVIIIIAVLAGIGIPQYLRAVEKGRAAEAIRILGSIKQAEDRYFAMYSTFTYVDVGDFTGANVTSNKLDVLVGALKYFNPASLSVEDANTFDTGAKSTGDVADSYTAYITRNQLEYTGLSGFGSDAYTVAMSSMGAIVAPALLK